VTPARGWRVGLLAAVVLAAAVVTGTLPPLRQDPAYHDFADQRAILGGPHGANVLSNAGFLLAGAWALVRVRRAALPGWERVAGVGFGLALVLTGVGSAWYHAAPSSATLVWDRLPLAALPATVLAVAVGDRVGPAAGRALLAPLALAAVGSVLWWQRTDDLRAYALAQFLPLLLVPLMLALLPGRRPAGPLLAGLALYGTARLAEAADRAVFLLGGVVSGHTLKHLLAAAAAVLVPWPLGSASPARESPGDYSTQGARP
jgi:hypothetical protein